MTFKIYEGLGIIDYCEEPWWLGSCKYSWYSKRSNEFSGSSEKPTSLGSEKLLYAGSSKLESAF